MKSLIICIAIAVIPVCSKAENPVFLGLRGAFNTLAPIPENTSNTLRTTAAELLARYVKPRQGSYLTLRKSGTSREWIELKGLQLTRVHANTLSQADHANGILASYWVAVDYEMHRNYNTAASKWSKWYNGRNPFVPTSIVVEQRSNRQWIARLPSSSTLVAQSSKGDPNIIPRVSNQAEVPVLPSKVVPTPEPVATQATVSNIKVVTSAQSEIPAPSNETKTRSWRGVLILGAIATALGAIVKELRPKRARTKRRRPNRTNSISSSPRAVPSFSQQPPPLPPSSFKDDSNPIDLMTKKQNLMTPAELAFFAVLEPIVRSSCMVSSKVRLADLFEVRQERGQQAAFNKIRSKHIDFVLTEPGSSRILCGIELDDSSHNRPERVERDDFVNELFAAQQLPLLRVPVAWTYYPQGLRSELLKAGVLLPSGA